MNIKCTKNALSHIVYLLVVSYINFAYASMKNDSDKNGMIALSLGRWGGEAKEYVYDGDNKISELTWKAKSSAIVKAKANHSLFTWLDINFNGWSTIASSGGSQSDRDWRLPDPSPENTTLNSLSNSSSTLNYANMFDFGLTNWLFQNQWVKLGILAGYKESRFSWTAHGGYFQNFDDPTQNQKMDGGIVGYKQTYKAPYIGVETNFYLNDFSFKTEFKYSHWVKAKGYDNHYLRKGFTSTDTASSAEMYSINQEVAYNLSPSFQVVAEAAWKKYKNHRADTAGTTEYDDKGNQEFYYIPGSGGISSSDYTMSAGIRYTF